MSEKLREMKRIAAEAFTAGWVECARYPTDTDGHARVAAEARYLSTLVEISTPPRCGSEKLREKIATVLRDCDGRPLVDYVDRILVALAESPESEPDNTLPGPSQAWVESLRAGTFCPICGVNVAVDEDGCCMVCGATATGPAVDALIAQSHIQPSVTAVEWESYGAGLDDVQLVSGGGQQKTCGEEPDTLGQDGTSGEQPSALPESASGQIADLAPYHPITGEVPTSMRHVIKVLTDAATHLLHDHDCDIHGHERIAVAIESAREYLALPEDGGEREAFLAFEDGARALCVASDYPDVRRFYVEPDCPACSAEYDFLVGSLCRPERPPQEPSE